MENPETLETKEYLRAQIPEGAKEGDVLMEENGALRLDRAETEARAVRIKDRFNSLRKK